MTVYNGERFLQEAIESCLEQTYSNFELIIIDDGSTDSSLDIINCSEDNRIVLLINESNKGQSYSRNRGIKESTGDYIAIMDADDVMYPNRLQKQLKILQMQNNTICFSWADIIDEIGEWVKLKKHISDGVLIYAKLIFECPLIHPTAMWNKEAFIDKNLWYDEAYVYAQDMEFWNRVKEYYSIVIIEEPLIKFRFGNSNSVSVGKREEQKKFADKVTKRELRQLGHMGPNPRDSKILIARIWNTLLIYKLFKEKNMVNDTTKNYLRDLLFPIGNICIPYRLTKLIKRLLVN